MNIKQCRRLKNDISPDKNINDLQYSFGLFLGTILDGNPDTSNWKELLAKASQFKPFYNMSITEVRAISSAHGSTSERIVYWLGTRGMKAFELVYLLDKMRLENVLLLIKSYEPIVILKHPPTIKSITEGTPLELNVEGVGFPYPRYQWFKWSAKQYQKMQRETNKSLYIDHARITDSGIYCCRLQNGNRKEHVAWSAKTKVKIIPHTYGIGGTVQENTKLRQNTVNEGQQHAEEPMLNVPLFATPLPTVSICDSPEYKCGAVHANTNQRENTVKEGQQHAEESMFNVPLYDKPLPTVTNCDPPEHTVTYKVALLIGNSDFIADQSLYGIPELDVKLLTSTFEQLKFTVFSLVNLSKFEINSMVDKFIEFITRLGDNVYVVFCFFGHGFEDSGKCYLVPTDAPHGYGPTDCVCADDILKKLQFRINPELIVMILDVCRIKNSNSRDKRRYTDTLDSLEETTRKGNTVVLYSTSKGLSAYQNQKNGILAKCLNKQIILQSGVINVMTAVQEDMRKEFANRKEDQIPEFRSNLAETRRSFKDKVELSLTVPWQCTFNKTREPIPSMGICLHLDFKAETLNVLLMSVSIISLVQNNEADGMEHILVSLKILSNAVRIERVRRVNNEEFFVLKDLQKVRDDLRVIISTKDIKTNTTKSLEINLKKPLISVLDLWQRNTSVIPGNKVLSSSA